MDCIFLGRVKIMPKFKCCGCKERFDGETMIKLPGGRFHSIDCAADYAHAKQQRLRDKQLAKDKRYVKAVEKADNKRFAAKKKEFWANDLKTRKAAAKLWCHAYIRERDKGLNCICCNKPMTGKVDAGHWIESGNYPAVRYDEDNIHAQSVHCNRHKGGDSGDYERNLRLKIGDSRVDRLQQKKHDQIKRTCEDYKKIEEYYKAKLKTLSKE